MGQFEQFVIDTVGKELGVFLISMLPIIELRGSVIIGNMFLNMNWLVTYIVSVIGNFLPVIPLLLFTRKIFDLLRPVKYIGSVIKWVEEHSMKRSKKIQEATVWGLFLFVAIPLPGTGAWTGCVIASLLDMRAKYAIPAVLGGILVAGVIMTLATTVLNGALSWLL